MRLLARSALFHGVTQFYQELLTVRRDNNEVFLLPIDQCYSLVGELRLRWQGFDGGAEAHAALAAFLAGLRVRALALAPEER